MPNSDDWSWRRLGWDGELAQLLAQLPTEGKSWAIDTKSTKAVADPERIANLARYLRQHDEVDLAEIVEAYTDRRPEEAG